MQKIILISFLILLNCCVTQFIPQISDDKEILVVEGLITDQPDTNTIKLSRSIPLGKRTLANPLRGCIVTISDDLDNIFILTETVDGTYVTDPAEFQGVIGRSYTLHIKNHVAGKDLNYESYSAKMIPVPPIDSLYYEKLTFNESNGIISEEGCQVYVNTHDATNLCKFYRWEFAETWEFHLPYTVPNNVCWNSNNSNVINIKNTTVLEEDRINRYPLNFISNITERLSVKYSILVNQYSLNEDEYFYWEKLQNASEQVGGLYDMIPASIPSNVYCLDDPDKKVLGYFSVSANSTKRIFIKEPFAGVKSPYNDHLCIVDTIYGYPPIPDLNLYLWVIIDHPLPPPGYQVMTNIHGCYDCRLRGTDITPDFWSEGK